MAGTLCYYCGSSWKIQEDHVIPGRLRTVPACRRCNQSKSDSTPAGWLDRLVSSTDSDVRYRWKAIQEWNYGRRNWFAKLVHARQ